MGKKQTGWSGPDSTTVLSKIAPEVCDYIDWYCENGLYLPPDYAKSPSEWNLVLRTIQKSFEAIVDDVFPPFQDVSIEEYNRGIELFYKHFKDLFK